VVLSAKPQSEALLRLPKLGQSMEAATVTQWHAAEGEEVQEGQLLASVETDKATYDLESPGTGSLHILVETGEEVPIDTILARIGGSGGREPPAPGEESPTPKTAPQLARAPSPGERVLASPKARRMAQELGVDLSTVTASGADGVVSAEDVERAAATTSSAASAPASSPPVVRGERLVGARATMARRMQESWQTVPHIVQMIDVDASGLRIERERFKAAGVAVTVNDLLLSSVARVLAGAPGLNVALVGDQLVRHDGVDVGFAVETPRGLYVPVIRGADALSVEALAAEAARLSAAAREGALRAADSGGASLTVSNLGMYGIRAGTPVISPGEPALVFVGAIEERAVVRNGGLAIRPMLTLSVAYDHRIIDGAAAARFTAGLKAALERTGEPAPPPVEAQHGPRELSFASAGAGFRVDVDGPGGRRWIADEPVADGGTDTGPTPVDALLGALASCLTISLRFAARRRKVPIDRVDGLVQANPTGHITSIAVELEVWSSAAEADVLALREPMERGCFVSGVFRGDLDYTVDIRVRSDGGTSTRS